MSIEAMNQAFEVPLVGQLESVPTNARLVIDDADGMGTRYIPVGRMCHDASKALRQAIAEAEKQEPVAWLCQKANGHFDVLTDQTCKKCFPVYTTPQPKQEQGYKDGYEAGWTKALNEAYSKREQEPVAWVNKERNTITWDKLYPDMDALYATPQRKPLTFEQVEDCFPEGASVFEDAYGDYHTSPRWLHAFARAIEAAHGIKE